MSASHEQATQFLKRGEFVKAETAFKQIIERQPDTPSAWFGLVHALEGQGRNRQAHRVCKAVVESNPGNVEALTMLGNQFLAFGDPRQALESFDAALQRKPDSSRGRSGRLYALRMLGRVDDVIAGCRENIGKDINVAESWWTLSSLRTCTFSDDDVEAMKSLRDGQSLSEADAAFVGFALGKAFDDLGRYDEAWASYETANATRRKAVTYNAAAHEALVTQTIKTFGPECARAASAANAAIPIFIVGMPRSGSTLVEQILASHSQVDATTELPYMGRLGDRYLAEAGRAGAGTENAATQSFQELGEKYLLATLPHRPEQRPYFIDKQPDNFLFAGLIAMLLPQAKIIDVRRNAIATCVGNYRQWFGQGKEFTYDLDELAQYYRQYVRLMTHWHQVMPGRVHEVAYEGLIENTEDRVRRLLGYCDLPWEDACLDFHRSEREVTTASAEQVRQPIYKSAVEFWRNYEKHLDDLKAVLGE